MAEARFDRGDDGRWSLTGELDYSSVPVLVTVVRDMVRSGNPVELDLQGVTRADSAGLALLVECLRAAEQVQHNVRFINVPDQLQSIARVSGLDRILSLPESGAD